MSNPTPILAARMQNELRRIYHDLLCGTLSKQEALEKICVLKSEHRSPRAETLLAVPVWDAGAPPQSRSVRYAERHVVLSGLAEVSAEKLGGLMPESSCVQWPALSAQDLAASYSECAAACFQMIQTVLRSRPQGKVLLQIVVADEAEPALLMGLTGLLRTATLENPQFLGQLILSEPRITATKLAQQLHGDAGLPQDTAIRYAQGARNVLRWQAVPEQHDSAPIAFKDRGVYLITGGVGDLGMLFAGEILGQTTQGRVILTGRDELTPHKQARLRDLSASANRFEYRQLEVAQPQAVNEFIAAVMKEYGHLDGILHCAGMISDNFILRKSAGEFSTVLAPKVAGTVNLDQACREIDLDFLVLFSSIAGAMGNTGQADYAAANGFMDGYAQYRNELVERGQRRGRTVSINWPLWKAGGMKIEAQSQAILEQTIGALPMQTATGLRAFHQSLSLRAGRLLVIQGDAARAQRWLSGVTSNIQPPEESSSKRRDAGADLSGLAQKAEQYLSRQLSAALKLPLSQIDPTTPLERFGIDSIIAVSLTAVLEKAFGSLPKTLFFEYQNIRELAKYFVKSHSEGLAALSSVAAERIPRALPAESSVETRQFATGRFVHSGDSSSERDTHPQRPSAPVTAEPIAIIGLSGRYPLANTLDEYWSNLREGRDCIVEVPPSRWDWRDYYAEDRSLGGHHYSKWGGFISGVDEFDPLFFNVPPRDAKFIDPQERLFLQHAWMAVEDAGYTRAALQGSDDRLGAEAPGHDVGVYVGVMYSEYQMLGVEASMQGRRTGIVGSIASIANRVSYCLNLHGPSIAVDTMCSSSLTAIHLACQDLRSGRTRAAVAGGVNVSIHPNKYLVLSAGHFISSGGQCQSFGEGGDGYIPAEGVGAVVLKRYSDAVSDGDHIYGLIRGSALSHGGRTNGYTVPNPRAQARVIRRALAESNVDPRQIGYIEAHGTGTKLGDPIEIAALHTVFGDQLPATGHCPLGSVKSNIGHTESAAGIAGITKVLLQMRHGQIVPSLHSAHLNPHIDFSHSPFVVNQALISWEQPLIDGRHCPRVAGVSSFGAGGANAHVIIEECPPTEDAASRSEQAGQDAPVAILLSARTQEQLNAKVRDLLEFLQSRLQEAQQSNVELHSARSDLASIAYTLQVGREAMDERLGLVVNSHGQLIEKLRAYVSGDRDIESMYQGSHKRGKELFALFNGDADLQHVVDKWFAEGNFAKLLELWVKGVDLDMRKLYGGVKPQRVSLPTYPFARERHWFEATQKKHDGGTVEQSHAVDQLHPLVHRNTSTLAQQSYCSIFTGKESFLETVGQTTAGVAVRILPREACLEMARTALALAIENVEKSNEFELRDVAWGQPFVATEERRIMVALNGTENESIDFEIYSAEAGEDVVHCQGQAVRSPQLVPAQMSQRIDLTAQQGEIARRPLPELISLAAPGAAIAEPSSLPAERTVTLCDAVFAQGEHSAAVRSAPDVELSDQGGGVFFAKTSSCVGAPGARIEALVRTLDSVKGNPLAKVLVISSADESFLFGEAEQINTDLQVSLCQAIASFPYPIIAALPLRATGAGFIAAALCDFMICAEEGKYLYFNPEQASALSTAEVALFEVRFGGVLARDFLSLTTAATGEQLRAKGWTVPVVPQAEVLAYAQNLASVLADKPRDALRLLKQQLMRDLHPLVEHLRIVDADSDAIEPVTDGADTPALLQLSTRCLRLDECDDGVLRITLDPERASTPRELLIELTTGIANASRSSRHKAIVLASTHPKFFPDSEYLEFQDAVLECQRAVLECQLPVIAALEFDASPLAWLFVQVCDHCIHDESGRYGGTFEWLGPTLANQAALFAYRFGEHLGNEILLTGASYLGAKLHSRAGTLAVAKHGEVMAHAMRVAGSWREMPREMLVAGKNRAARRVREWLGQLPVWTVAMDAEQSQLPAVPTAMELRSNVVAATIYPAGIVVVKMEDRQAKNMFSAELIAGIEEVFARVERSSAFKVVVLTGYENYFASGGTRENLLAIQQGAAQFTDVRCYEVALKSPVPVIAAMQGHGIGAGWVLGMFADATLFCQEARYVSPYMSYGFTPGAGSTLVFPKTMGYDLARESLLTAREYGGRELQRRCAWLQVLPRDQVLPAALELAGQIARQPRSLLTGFKHQFSHRLRQQLEETYQLELDMHAQSFVGRADTVTLIRDRFVQAADDSLDLTSATELPPIAAGQANDSDVRSAVGADAAAITASLKRLLADELQMGEETIEDDMQFVELGLDSISGVTWMRKINERYGISIEATRIYSHPTLKQLSSYVREEVGKLSPVKGLSDEVPVKVALSESVAPPPAVPGRLMERGMFEVAPRLVSRRARGRRGVSVAVPGPEPIAVIGMAGQFPGARDIQEYWRNITSGRDCIAPIAADRWDVDAYYEAGAAVAGKTNCRWFGALPEYDRFDPLFFNLSPSEAEAMDPQQRLFLQACWQGIEDAGYAASSLSGSKCGVFVGCASGDYHQSSNAQRLSAQGFTGSASSILASRISYFLNLQGPCLAIDTACSSSLVAIANACDSLCAGVSELALAGGVYVMGGPEMHIRTSQAGMLSAQGRCFAFDQRANGFVPGEAVGVVVLKRLSDARRDRDVIYGVIRGWGVNQDGKTNGITAPNPAAQTRLQQEVYERHGIDPGNIQLLEAHGTGTQLGDPIEVRGLKDAFGKYTRRQGYCALGSVKSNIGHCLTAAGVAGFIKLVLSLQHRQLPPTIHFERLNEHIELAGSPFYINSELREWSVEGGGTRQGAVSSFGFSGTNAHVVVEEHREPESRRWSFETVRGSSGNSATIVPLSARTAEGLRRRAEDLLTFLDADATVDLLEVAYTLQVGREAMEHRIGFYVDSIEQLADRLRSYLNDDLDIAGVVHGEARKDKESLAFLTQDAEATATIVDRWVATRQLSKLAELWCRGLNVDWNRLYGTLKPRRICMPTYPFAKERYWIGNDAIRSISPRAALHPLLHVNVSTLETQSYRTTFSGEETFLNDHRVRMKGGSIHKVLPGVACLEMVRAALADALPSWPGSLQLHDTIWMKPVVVPDCGPVFLSLVAIQDGRERHQINYRIHSGDGAGEIVHCRGRATFASRTSPARIDVAQLKGQMRAGKLQAAEIYAALVGRGLHHGPTYRGIEALYLGEAQLLAQLYLPQLESSGQEYLLHPGMMDSAAHALIGLTGSVGDIRQLPEKPLVPFALEHLQVVAGCVGTMLAWVRYAPHRSSGKNAISVDIDLCDEQGNVCVLMRGLSCRTLDNEAASLPRRTLHATIDAETSAGEELARGFDVSFDSNFYGTVIDRIAGKKISVEDAIKLE